MKKVEIQDQDIAKYLVRANANSLELIRANDLPTREAAFSAFCKEISNPQITHIIVGRVGERFKYHDVDNFTLRLARAIKKNGDVKHLEAPTQSFPSERLFLDPVAEPRQYAVSHKTTKSFCEALKANPKLEYLDLSYSKIEELALTDIILTLQQHNAHLSIFNIELSDFGPSSLKALQSLVSNHKSLNILNISDALVHLNKNSAEHLLFISAIKNMALANPKLTIKIAYVFKEKMSVDLIADINQDIGSRLQIAIKDNEPKLDSLRSSLNTAVKLNDISDIIIEYTYKFTELVILGVDAPEVDYLNQDAIA